MDHCWYSHVLADEQFIMMCHEFVSVSFCATLPSLSKFVPPSSISHFHPNLRFLHGESCSAWRCDDISGTMRYMFCDFSDVRSMMCTGLQQVAGSSAGMDGKLEVCWWDGNPPGKFVLMKLLSLRGELDDCFRFVEFELGGLSFLTKAHLHTFAPTLWPHLFFTEKHTDILHVMWSCHRPRDNDDNDLWNCGILNAGPGHMLKKTVNTLTFPTSCLAHSWALAALAQSLTVLCVRSTEERLLSKRGQHSQQPATHRYTGGQSRSGFKMFQASYLLKEQPAAATTHHPELVESCPIHPACLSFERFRMLAIVAQTVRMFWCGSPEERT